MFEVPFACFTGIQFLEAQTLLVQNRLNLFSHRRLRCVEGKTVIWSNINRRLKSHECSSDHAQCMFKWRELDMRLQKNMTIDHQELTLLEAEKRRWRNVLKHLLKITLSLASRNLPFRGSSQCLYEPDNGNFLKEVELLGSFDAVIIKEVCLGHQHG